MSRHILANLKSDFLRTAIYPWHQQRWFPSADFRLRELKALEYKPLADLERVQSLRLQGLLRHAATQVPYYRNWIKENGANIENVSPKTMSLLPILTKDILRQRISELVTEGLDVSRLTANASGGSTGRPVQLYQDQNYWDEARASQWFVESWWGIRPGDRTASVWGTDRDLPPQGWKENISATITQIRVCNAFALDRQRLEKFARMLDYWQPRFVIGYASALNLFAEFLLESPGYTIRPKAVKTTAEVLRPAERQAIEKAFQAPVYDFYGSRESNNIAAQCELRGGLHINHTGRLVEIVDEKGNALPPGVFGRVLVTDLTNHAMPMIRYENEDISSISAEPCACGRAFPMLAKIEGRKSDFILTPSKKLIHGEYFTHLFYDLPQVSTFQVIQESLCNVRVEIVLENASTTPDFGSLKSKMQAALGQEVNLVISVVDKIDRPESGKHRFTTSKVAIPWGAASDV